MLLFILMFIVCRYLESDAVTNFELVMIGINATSLLCFGILRVGNVGRTHPRPPAHARTRGVTESLARTRARAHVQTQEVVLRVCAATFAVIYVVVMRLM